MLIYSYINQLAYQNPSAFSQVEPGVFGRKGKMKGWKKRKNNSLWRNKSLFGGNRERVILRDGEKCVECGMTREEHKRKWGRDITVDHIDGNGRNVSVRKKNNNMDNLQTLCLSCHGSKDTPINSISKEIVIKIRKEYKSGETSTYKLANKYGMTQGNVWHIVSGKTWTNLKE